MFEIQREFQQQYSRGLDLLGLDAGSHACPAMIAATVYATNDLWKLTSYTDKALSIEVDGKLLGEVISVGQLLDHEELVSVVYCASNGGLSVVVVNVSLLIAKHMCVYASNSTGSVYTLPARLNVKAGCDRSYNIKSSVLSSRVDITPEGIVSFDIRNTSISVDRNIASPFKIYHDSVNKMLLLSHVVLTEPTNIIIPLKDGDEVPDYDFIEQTAIHIEFPLRYLGESLSAPMKVDRDSIGRTQLSINVAVLDLFE